MKKNTKHCILHFNINLIAPFANILIASFANTSIYCITRVLKHLLGIRVSLTLLYSGFEGKNPLKVFEAYHIFKK